MCILLWISFNQLWYLKHIIFGMVDCFHELASISNDNNVVFNSIIIALNDFFSYFLRLLPLLYAKLMTNALSHKYARKYPSWSGVQANFEYVPTKKWGAEYAMKEHGNCFPSYLSFCGFNLPRFNPNFKIRLCYSYIYVLVVVVLRSQNLSVHYLKSRAPKCRVFDDTHDIIYEKIRGNAIDCNSQEIYLFGKKSM